MRTGSAANTVLSWVPGARPPSTQRDIAISSSCLVGRGVRAAPCKAVRVTPPEHVDTDAADMALTPERRAVIVGAMQRVSLKYVPVWALHVPEERWVKTVIQAKARE